jgi:hypothetical protein
MEPASTVIRLCGGPNAVSKVVGVHRTRVWNWTVERERGGTGGLIPQKHHAKILAFAMDNKIPLGPEHFVQLPRHGSEAIE